MEKEILNMEEAAELFSVSVKTFIKLLKEEKVPARKIGREWRFSKKALVDWLASGDSQAYSASEGDAKEFFNQVAPEWEEIRKRYYDASVKNKIIEMNILKKHMTVMDLGAGDGYLSRTAAGLVEKVVAVDISAEMLKELRRKAGGEGLANIETIESDGQDVPVADSSIDLVCASMYLHHIEEPELAIKEMSRVLKPGGRVFLADLLEHADDEMKTRMHDIWPGFKTSEMKIWFKNNGFKGIHMEVLHNDDDLKGNRSMERIFILTAVKP